MVYLIVKICKTLLTLLYRNHFDLDYFSDKHFNEVKTTLYILSNYLDRLVSVLLYR